MVAMTSTVKQILANYETDTVGVKTNLARMLMHGELAGTGKMVILPVDQGFEHGPARSFAPNPDSYDPHYHYQLAVDSGCSAYAAPLGPLSAGAGTFIGQIPTILKMNSSNSLASAKDQAVTASIKDAVELGCSAIGFTIYPGAEPCFDMMEEIRELSREAKDYGIPTVLWAYARGSMSKEGETALDIIAYAAHMACLLGAHVVKVKLPDDLIELKEAKPVYEKYPVASATQAERVAHVVKSCMNGKRMVVFSGGSTKSSDSVLDDARAIRDGGGNGSIIGRNCFQRPREEALEMLSSIMKIYKGEM